MAKLHNGLKIGHIVLIEIVRRNKVSQATWKCKCICGLEFERCDTVLLEAIRNDTASSCGCQTELTRRQSGTSRYKKRYTELSQKYPEPHPKRRRGSYAVTIISEMKNSIKTRGKEWQLDDLAAFELCLQPCYYCGLEADFPITRNGLDRVDNNKHYTPDNVVPCCITCNRAKMSQTLEEFKLWIIKVYNQLNFSNSLHNLSNTTPSP